MHEVLRSDPADWEIRNYEGDPVSFKWGASHKLNPDLKIEISSNHQAEGVPEVTLMIRWHRRLVHTDKGLFGDGEIVLPHPEPTAFSFTTHHEELWRLVHAIRGCEDEYDRALEQRRLEVK
jgi:hypothetical protein